MKTISFNCPACRYPLRVPVSAASDTGPCPECGQVITGPGLDPNGESKLAAAPDPTPPATKDEWADTPELTAPSRTVARAAAPAAPVAPVAPAAPAAPAAPVAPVAPAAPPVTTRRGLGVGAVLALCILSAITCLGIGYQLGRASNPSAPPQAVPPDGPRPQAPSPPVDPARSPAASADPASPAADPAPATPPAAASEEPPEEPPAESGPVPAREAAFRAFLDAPDWTSRQDHVLHAKLVAPDMKSLATKHGDGPIDYTSLTSMHQTDNSAVFQVTTGTHPKGFPVVLALEDDRWLVDWSGFAEFYYNLFRAFASGGTETTGTFRLLVKPDLARAEDPGRQPFIASSSDPDAPTIVFAPDGSPVHQALEDMIGDLAAKAPGSFRSLMETGGVPLILRVSKTMEEDRTILVIDEIVALGWSPLPPESP